MSANIDRAAKVITLALADDADVSIFGSYSDVMDVSEATLDGAYDLTAVARALADAGLLMPDTPGKPDAWGKWDVNGLEVNAADKDGEVRIEWEEESDYAYYGPQTRTLWLSRDQVTTILAAAESPLGVGGMTDGDTLEYRVEHQHIRKGSWHPITKWSPEWPFHEGYYKADDERVVCRRVSTPWEVTNE